jgi:hypothetical protein
MKGRVVGHLAHALDRAAVAAGRHNPERMRSIYSPEGAASTTLIIICAGSGT